MAGGKLLLFRHAEAGTHGMLFVRLNDMREESGRGFEVCAQHTPWAITLNGFATPDCFDEGRFGYSELPWNHADKGFLSVE
jgi:hypothetical protein